MKSQVEIHRVLIEGTMLLSLSSLATAKVPAKTPNMNGDYLLAATPGSNVSRFPTRFSDYPGLETKSFDVYSPLVSQLYSQVFWKGLDPVPLPADIVSHFAGKTMAVVGFEVDQVMRTAEGDISVPINVAYNHHFESKVAAALARSCMPSSARVIRLRCVTCISSSARE